MTQCGTSVKARYTIKPGDQALGRASNNKIGWPGCRSGYKLVTIKPSDVAGDHSKDVSDWDIDHVIRWLNHLDLGQYCDVFKSHDIHGRELLELSHQVQRTRLMSTLLSITSLNTVKSVRTRLKILARFSDLMLHSPPPSSLFRNFVL